jgi:hypothetical protein
MDALCMNALESPMQNSSFYQKALFLVRELKITFSHFQGTWKSNSLDFQGLNQFSRHSMAVNFDGKK